MSLRPGEGVEDSSALLIELSPGRSHQAGFGPVVNRGGRFQPFRL
jgi:hypothetical protein